MMCQGQRILAVAIGLCFFIIGGALSDDPVPEPKAAGTGNTAIDVPTEFKLGADAAAKDSPKCGLKATKFTIKDAHSVTIEGLSFDCAGGSNGTGGGGGDKCNEVYFTVGTYNTTPLDRPEDGGKKFLPTGHKIPNHNKTCGRLVSPFTPTTPLDITLPKQYHFGPKTDFFAIGWFSLYCWDYGNSFDLGRIWIGDVAKGVADPDSQADRFPDVCDPRGREISYPSGSETVGPLATGTAMYFGFMAMTMILLNGN